MTVGSYLKYLADKAIVRDDDKDFIDSSTQYIGRNIDSYFGNQVNLRFPFGSQSRGTMLPRFMDDNADVDYMVLFEDSQARPQTYLDRLRRFVCQKYRSSEIYPSRPAVVLELNHIKFELVPAIPIRSSVELDYAIPAKTSDYKEWMETTPHELNRKLTDKNKEHDNIIKPVVRLVKYWNVVNGYPFSSYQLEKEIVDYPFEGYEISNPKPDLKKYFFDFMKDKPMRLGDAEWKKHKLCAAQKHIKQIEAYLSKTDYLSAKDKLKQLLPDPKPGNKPAQHWGRS